MVTLDQAGAGIPSLGIRRVAPGLGPWIEHLWLETFTNRAGPPGSWRIVPDASGHLLYHRFRDDGRSPRLLLVGPRTVAVDVDRTARSMSLGARLRPDAVPALFGFPADELTDRCVDLESVPGLDGRGLREELDRETARRGPRILETWLHRRVAPAGTPDPRVGAAVRRLGRGTPCGEVADHVGVSPRGLRALVRRRVGLPPRTVGRIVRLHGALRRIGEGRPSWSRVAVASGYFDQAHMIREFRRFLGETPEAWRRRSDRAPTGRRDG